MLPQLVSPHTGFMLNPSFRAWGWQVAQMSENDVLEARSECSECQWTTIQRNAASERDMSAPTVRPVKVDKIHAFLFPPFFLPMPPITSPFLARTPSRGARCPMSFSNAPPFGFVTLFVRAAFFFLSFFVEFGRRSGSPIFAGRDAFFAERTAARIAPVSSASSSIAIFLRFARLESPANLSRLGWRAALSCGRINVLALRTLASAGSFAFPFLLASKPASYCCLLTAKGAKKASVWGHHGDEILL